jgi:hypothetical protein
MAPPSLAKPPRAEALNARPASAARATSRRTWLLPAVLLGLFGCQRTIDIASVQDPTWVATTIPYTGVREPTRQFPDYSSIDASILDKNANPAAPGKKGAPR